MAAAAQAFLRSRLAAFVAPSPLRTPKRRLGCAVSRGRQPAATAAGRGRGRRRQEASRRHRVAATPSDDDKPPEIEGVDYDGIEALAQSLSSAAAGMKIDELEAQAKSSMKEADLLEGQAAAVEREAARLEVEIARRNEGEEDDKKRMIHERMLAVARLDAKEQRMLADAVRSIAEKAVVTLEEAQEKRAAETDDSSE